MARSIRISVVSRPCLYAGCSSPRKVVCARRAPCIRQVGIPNAAGFRHWFPLRFDRARHCFAPCRRRVGRGKDSPLTDVFTRLRASAFSLACIVRIPLAKGDMRAISVQVLASVASASRKLLLYFSSIIYVNSWPHWPWLGNPHALTHKAGHHFRPAPACLTDRTSRHVSPS